MSRTFHLNPGVDRGDGQKHLFQNYRVSVRVATCVAGTDWNVVEPSQLSNIVSSTLVASVLLNERPGNLFSHDRERDSQSHFSAFYVFTWINTPEGTTPSAPLYLHTRPRDEVFSETTVHSAPNFL